MRVDRQILRCPPYAEFSEVAHDELFFETSPELQSFNCSRARDAALTGNGQLVAGTGSGYGKRAAGPFSGR